MFQFRRLWRNWWRSPRFSLRGQGSAEQTIETLAVSLAEKFVEVPVIQRQRKTQQGVNTHVQQVVDTVEVEKHIIQTNQVTKHIHVPQMQVVEKTVEGPQLQIVEKTAKTPETQIIQGTQTSESVDTATARQGSRSKRPFLQNPLHPCSSQNPSRKLLQLLLRMCNPLLSGST